MKYTLVPATLVAAAVTAAMLAGCGKAANAPAPNAAAAAEAAKPNPYAELNKLPDWSGVWEPARFAGRPNTPPPGANGAAAAPLAAGGGVFGRPAKRAGSHTPDQSGSLFSSA